MKTTIKRICILFTLLLIFSCKNETKRICDIPTEVNYKDHVSNLIEVHCAMCHAPEVYKKKASRIKIFDYPSLKIVAESGQLIGSITHATGFIAMPYRREEKIDSCAIEVFKKWVATGMKE